MIYTADIPDDLKLNTEIFKAELDYFYQNLPKQELDKLQQFALLPYCRMYFVNIYHPNAPEQVHNINIDTPEKHYFYGQTVFSHFIEKKINNQPRDYRNNNFFEQTIAAGKLNKKINNIALLYIKPNTTISKHVHPEDEHIVHTLINNMEKGYLQVYCEKDTIKVNKKNQYFMHKANWPHGGHTTEMESWVLSVAATLE